NRQVEGIHGADDAVDWFVANLAQQGPNLLESVATAAAGFFGGSAVGTPIAGAGASVAGLVGKAAFKKAVIEAAQEYAEAKAVNDVAKMAAAKTVLKRAAGIAGAVTLTAADNYRLGVGDTYNELRETGSQPGDIVASLTALGAGVPYAALESVPEFILGA